MKGQFSEGLLNLYFIWKFKQLEVVLIFWCKKWGNISSVFSTVPFLVLIMCSGASLCQQCANCHPNATASKGYVKRISSKQNV